MSDKHYLEAELEERIQTDPDIWNFIRASSLDGVWYWDLDNPSHEYMSPEFWTTFGYDPSTKSHDPGEWQTLIFPEDLAVAKTNMERHLADPSHPYDQIVRYRRQDGGTSWVRCRGIAVRDESGKPVRMLGAHNDMTDLVQANLRNRQVIESSHRLTAVLNAAQSAIIGVDRDGMVSFVNDQARHILGGIQAETPFAWPQDINFLDAETMQRLESSRDPVQRAIAGRPLKSETAIMSRKSDDDPRYVRISSAAIAKAAQTDVTLVLVIDDVSVQEKNRQQVERSSRLDALGQLTGGIAHDFNNLLATISYSVQLAVDRTQDDKAANYLMTALASVRRGADLTGRLLAFAKHQPGLAISAGVDGIMENFAKIVRPTIEEQITLSFEIDDSDLWVFCDTGQLENALLNLVLNSRDAILRAGRGNRIVIKARGVAEIEADTILRHEDPHTYIAKGLHVDHAAARARRSGYAYRYVEFAVTDNGPGMTEGVKRRAIDPFFTTKDTNSGTGLGLSMVYGFIQQASGELRIYSELDHGTTVRLLIPRGTPEGAREQPVERLPAPTGVGQRILVVEDEEGLLQMMCEVINSLGYKAIPSTSGRDARDRLHQGLDFDLLLTDVVMPGGIGGFELAKEVRAINPNLPVVYMSGYTGFSDAEMGAVVAPLIQKPSPPAELARTLESALSLRA